MSRNEPAPKHTITRLRNVFLAVLSSVSVVSPTTQSLHANGVPFQTGDVLAGVGNGIIKHFSPDGALLDTLNTGANSFNTGMAFDAAGNLYATAFNAQSVFRIDNKGNLLGTFGSGYDSDPESILFDRAGNAYVGQADGLTHVLKFNPTGGLVGTFGPNVQDRGTDWIDLAADQCTLFYTSEGNQVKRFNVCNNAQLSDFATLPEQPAYALRIRPNGEVIVAASSHVYRLDSSGVILSLYAVAGASALFALNLDPDNKTIWTGDIANGTIARIDIATGAIITRFNAAVSGQFGALAGLTVVGEITAAVTTPPATTSYYIETTDSTKLRNAGRDLALAQLAAGGRQESVVALLFGAPRKVGTSYGASLWGHASSTTTIASLVQDFVIGYYNSLGPNSTDHVRVIIATSNDGSTVTLDHGVSWANMVNSVASWAVQQGYSGQVDIAGGSNIEPNFDAADVTRTWVDGYASVAQRFLYNVGAAVGCPTTGTTSPGGCYNGWSQEDLWYVSWGSPPAEPLPEIYSNTNAKQWAALSLYGYLKHNGSIIYAGALTEAGACSQVPPGSDSTCPGNTASQGWQQLHDALNADNRTAQTLSWSTDIRWLQ